MIAKSNGAGTIYLWLLRKFCSKSKSCSIETNTTKKKKYIQEYNDYATNLKNKYNPILENYQVNIEDAKNQLTQLQSDYSTQKNELFGSAEEFDTALETVYMLTKHL